MKTDYLILTDPELVERLRHSDGYAFEEIYKRYKDHILIYANKLLNNNDQAQDLVQDVFTTIFVNMSTVNIPSLSSYLHRSVRNEVIALYRHHKTKRNYFAFFKKYTEEGHCTTDAILREKELNEEIEREIARLPKKMRAVFEMSRKQYLNHQQIAEASGLEPGTVKKQMYNAITRLRSRLKCIFFLYFMYAILMLNKIISLITNHN